MTKTLLVVLYPLLLVAWLANLVLRRDRLGLQDRSNNGSYWIERRGRPNTAAYFSEASCAEGGNEPSAAMPVARLLRAIAHLYAPPRCIVEPIYKASVDRERGIPDEVYTLW